MIGISADSHIPDAKQMAAAETDRLEGDTCTYETGIVFQAWQDRK